MPCYYWGRSVGWVEVVPRLTYSSSCTYYYDVIYRRWGFYRIFAARFSGDARYVITGSDDTNIRLWKAVADEPIKIVCLTLHALDWCCY